ncbi:MAG: tRNA guanosine(34) transglycosylase Tgt [Gemmatimonadetes bacterium]|nr:tRNA guanosine(34) transglycosylase Tgt [Gemmatimonadota bacterium]
MFEFELEATDGAARAGRWMLPRGTVETPCFMPVGTQGSVRTLSPKDLEAIGATLILANTYHLFVRPGEEVVAKLGGLHKFMGWPGPILTDSGGFQVFSLEGMREVTEEGVEFRSHLDGSLRFLSPERAVEVQRALGADIAMAFDHVIPGQSGRAEAEDAMERTLRWLERCRRRHGELAMQEPGAGSRTDGASESDVDSRDGAGSALVWPITPKLRLPAPGSRQTLVPIIQGGVYRDLRRNALVGILQIGDWHGIAVGGLSVGEPKGEMQAVLEDLETVLPKGIPRYLMGVGFPEDFVAAVGRGMDLADCVAPTRMGRNGTGFTDDGPVNIRNARFREDDAPLDVGCDCEACTTFSRGYLRHLFAAEELLGLRLLSLHNVRYLIRLAARARAAIVEGTFEGWSRSWLARYTSRESK